MSFLVNQKRNRWAVFLIMVIGAVSFIFVWAGYNYDRGGRVTEMATTSMPTVSSPVTVIANGTDSTQATTSAIVAIPEVRTKDARPTSTIARTTSTPSTTDEEEDLFTLVLSPETVEHFQGRDSWTQEIENYYYVMYQAPTMPSPKYKIRLDEIVGFSYDPDYTYTISVRRSKDEMMYGAEDAPWYRFTLDSVRVQTLLP